MSSLLSFNHLEQLFKDFQKYIPNPFCVQGKTDLPSITIHKTDENESFKIDYPISKDVLKKLKSISSPSPFGVNKETKLDETVRKSVELDTSQFTIHFAKKDTYCDNQNTNKKKDVSIDNYSDNVMTSRNMKILEQIRGILAPHVPYIECKPYKLLLYEKDGHFEKHIDSMKEIGHFATLILELPCVQECKHQGGDLVLEFENQQMIWNNNNNNNNKDNTSSTVDMKKGSCSKSGFVAFYCDIYHSISPIKQGIRVTVTLNIIIPKHLLVSHVTKSIKEKRESWLNRIEKVKNELDHIESILNSDQQVVSIMHQNQQNHQNEFISKLQSSQEKQTQLSIYQKQIYKALTKSKLIENLNVPHPLLRIILKYMGEHEIIDAIVFALSDGKSDEHDRIVIGSIIFCHRYAGININFEEIDMQSYNKWSDDLDVSKLLNNCELLLKGCDYYIYQYFKQYANLSLSVHFTPLQIRAHVGFWSNEEKYMEDDYYNYDKHGYGKIISQWGLYHKQRTRFEITVGKEIGAPFYDWDCFVPGLPQWFISKHSYLTKAELQDIPCFGLFVNRQQSIENGDIFHENDHDYTYYANTGTYDLVNFYHCAGLLLVKKQTKQNTYDSDHDDDYY